MTFNTLMLCRPRCTNQDFNDYWLSEHNYYESKINEFHKLERNGVKLPFPISELEERSKFCLDRV